LAKIAVVALTKGMSSPAAAFWVSNLTLHSSIRIPAQITTAESIDKEKLTLFSDHSGSLLRRQPKGMTIGHSPERKAKPQMDQLKVQLLQNHVGLAADVHVIALARTGHSSYCSSLG